MNQNIRIMQLVYSLNMGGLENLVLDLTRALDREKYTVSVCSLTSGGDLIPELSRSGISCFEMDKKDGVDLFLHLRLANLLRQQNIDLLHTHNSAPFFYGTTAAKMAGTPVIVHTEHSKRERKEKRVALASKILYKSVDAVVADCQDVADNLSQKQSVSKDKIKIIFNGIDIDKFSLPTNIEKKKEELAIDRDSFVIGNVARLVPVKDHITLLESFAIVHKTIPQTVLLIVGDGILTEDLKRYASELGLAKSVKFLGTRTDIPEILSVFDIFVLSSLSEGLSLTLLEAMAAGLPIVATSVGGNQEVIIDGLTGLLVPTRKPKDFADAIEKLFIDKQLAKKMKEAAKKRVSEYFTLDRMSQEYMQLYKDCFVGVNT